MAQHRTEGEGGERLFANGLWVAAALIVVAGFLLRSLSSVIGHRELRLAGIIVIGIGIVLAVIGWIGERLAGRRAARKV